MKTNKEILALPIDSNLSPKEKLNWYKKGFLQGKNSSNNTINMKNRHCSHAWGYIDGWIIAHPEKHLINILEGKTI